MITTSLQYDPGARSTKWLLNTCRQLLDHDWPTDQPLSFDGSSFLTDYRDEANRMFFGAVLRHGKGKTLSLKNLSLSLKARKALEEIILSNSELHSLFLYKVVNDEEFRCLPDLFSNTNIQELTIDRCQISPQVALSLGGLIGSGSLKSLKLINADLGTDALEIFKGVAKGSLTHFKLRQARINEKNLAFLLDSLATNTSLRSLHLDVCGIGLQHADDLANLLQTNQHLTTLSLLSNDLDGESMGILTERGLQHNQTLRTLHLSHNPIGDDGARHLTTLLCSDTNPSSLQSLSLVDCEIWGPGVTSLAGGLAQMQGLKQLLVDGEWEDHVDLLLKSMESNMILTQLWTARSAMLIHEDPQWNKIEFYLRLNRGKRRMLVDARVPATLWPRVLSDLGHDASLVYHMLRQKPELVS